MSINTIINFIETKAEEFGAKNDDSFNKSYVIRNNTGAEALKDNGAYFGFIHPEEEASGPFHDFSLTIFPSNPNEPGKSWLVCLGIGSNGFKNDYELATYPGLRRLFSKLVDENGFCKSDFSDLETNLPKPLADHSDLQHIKNTIKKYIKVLPACQIVDDPESDNGKKIIAAFVAGYARLRDWPSNNEHRNAVSKALAPFLQIEAVNEAEEIKKLLHERKYVVLQGPPGTGKTRIAKKIASDIKAKTFFTQFHAETSYSDFIFGIRPDLESNQLKYIKKPGIFSEAIEYAKNHIDKKAILIIDEINRANLANILGPIFYLFEHKMEDSGIDIEINPDLKINKIPNNLLVIATMNTADRSLAVVDFALRRRFAWYSKKPSIIKGPNKKLETCSVNTINDSTFFFIEEFVKFDEIFSWYANSNELNLQPGEGYFIANSEKEMENRIHYELFPLIKEYLQEGLLQNAKEEFNKYFSTKIKKTLFE